MPATQGDLDWTDRSTGLSDMEKETCIKGLHRKLFDRVWTEVSKILIELATKCFIENTG